MHSEHREPLIRISKRQGMPFWRALGIRLIAVALALVVAAVVIFAIVHMNPIRVYLSMISGNFGTKKRIWYMLRDTAVLACIAIGLAPAFKMRFWNIGAEGQVMAGALACATVMITLGNTITSNWLMLLIMLVVSVAAGALWGFLPAFFKAHWNTNETLFTLMMNYIAIQLAAYFIIIWEVPKGSGKIGMINQNTHIGWLPYIGGKQYAIIIILIAILTVLLHIYLKYSKQGYEIAVVGESERTARYAGISVKKVTIRTMALSGAICGLAGFIAVSGASHTISTSTAGGRGFTAIIVAWLAQFNSFIMILISFLLVFLQKGAIQIASQFNLNDYASDVITGIILFFILGSEFFINYRIILRRKEHEHK